MRHDFLLNAINDLFEFVDGCELENKIIAGETILELKTAIIRIEYNDHIKFHSLNNISQKILVFTHS